MLRMNTNGDSMQVNLKEYCTSIASQASDIYNEMFSKLTNLLALVDISVQMENNSNLQRLRRTAPAPKIDPLTHSLALHNPREKRFAFLASFIFSNGVRLLWGMFGFYKK